MPRQNRPLVRDGRLQAKKKRTDRSYLGVSTKPQVEESTIEEETLEPEVDAVAQDEAPVAEVAPEAEPVGAVAATAAPVRLSGSARALQQQGRRRRELDVDALAERDTRYALHELRRILILTTLVIVTLIVLGFVLR